MLDSSEFDVVKVAERIVAERWRQCEARDREYGEEIPTIAMKFATPPMRFNVEVEEAKKVTSAERDEEIRRISNHEEFVFTTIFIAIMAVLVIGVSLLFFH